MAFGRGTGGTASELIALESIEALRADVPLSVNSVRVVNDPLRGGLFYWDKNPGRDDDTTRYNQGGYNSNTAGWVREYEGGELDAGWANVRGDGVTDDTTAIIRLFAAAGLSTSKTRRVAFEANSDIRHTGFTIPSQLIIDGWAQKGVNTVVGGARFRALNAGAKIRVHAISSRVYNCIFDGNNVANTVLEFQETSYDVTLDGICVTRAAVDTGKLIDFPGTLELDNIRILNSTLVQDLTDATKYAASIVDNSNPNALNIYFRDCIVANGHVIGHYAQGSCSFIECQIFRFTTAAFYIESACKPFQLEKIYNEGDTAPFLNIVFNAGVKSADAIVLRDCLLNGATPIITACTQQLVLDNVSLNANISVTPVPEWGMYGVDSNNTVFKGAGVGFIGTGALSRVDENNTWYDPFGANVRVSRYRLPAAPYTGAQDSPNSAVVQTGGGPAVTITGQPANAGRFAIRILVGGAIGVAEFEWSSDFGATWSGPTLVAGAVALGATGLTANFAAGVYVLNEYYTWVSGIGGEFGTDYWLANLTANRTFPLFPASVEGQRVHVSLVGVTHGFTADIQYGGVSLAVLKNEAGSPAWATFIYDNSAAWVIEEIDSPVIQKRAVQVADIAVAAGAGFVDMGAMTLTFNGMKGNSYLEFNFDCNVTNDAGSFIMFQVMIDGVLIPGTNRAILVGGGGWVACQAISGKTGILAAGNHTIKVQWSCFAGNSQCRATTAAGFDGAQLLATEVGP